MIYYTEIENLPADHPKVKAFIEQEKALDDAYAEAGPMSGPGEDEESKDYFDRYIAGDR